MSQCMIGVPKELKAQEGRVGITPDGVRALRKFGIDVAIQEGAGLGAGLADGEYVSAGAIVYSKIEDLYRDADIIVKVKEPTPAEYPLLPLLQGKTLFTYLHLAGVDPELTKLLLAHKVNAIAYENVIKEVNGRTTFPLLAPMSQIAGTQAMRGALLRHQVNERRQLRAVILGGGNVGEAALVEALAHHVASIAVFELNEDRRAALECAHRIEYTASFFPFSALETWGRAELNKADIVICAVLTPGGAAAPIVLTQKHFRRMKHGCFIADVAIDQGGSTAWSKVTKPGETFTRGKNALVFSCVPNIPGSTVPREATEALTKATIAHVCVLGLHVMEHNQRSGLYWALKGYPDLRAGLQTFSGFLVNSSVCAKHQLEWAYKPMESLF